MICVSLGWRSQRQEGPGARERVSREPCFRAGRPDAAARAGGHLDLAPPLSPFFRAVLIWHFEKKCSQTVTCRSSSYVFKEPTVRRTDRQTGNRKERDTSAERKRHKPNAPQKRQRLKKAAPKGPTPPTSERGPDGTLVTEPTVLRTAKQQRVCSMPARHHAIHDPPPGSPRRCLVSERCAFPHNTDCAWGYSRWLLRH